MQIKTQVLGELEIIPQQIFHFPFGLYAFEDLHSFALLDAAEKPFYWLQSLEFEELAFLLVQPQLLCSDYQLSNVSWQEFNSIGLKDKDDEQLLSFGIITLNQQNPTVNLQGPVLLNKKQKLGRQVILHNDKWGVRHDLVELFAKEVAS